MKIDVTSASNGYDLYSLLIDGSVEGADSSSLLITELDGITSVCGYLGHWEHNFTINGRLLGAYCDGDISIFLDGSMIDLDSLPGIMQSDYGFYLTITVESDVSVPVAYTLETDGQVVGIDSESGVSITGNTISGIVDEGVDTFEFADPSMMEFDSDDSLSVVVDGETHQVGTEPYTIEIAQSGYGAGGYGQ